MWGAQASFFKLVLLGPLQCMPGCSTGLMVLDAPGPKELRWDQVQCVHGRLHTCSLSFSQVAVVGTS